MPKLVVSVNPEAKSSFENYEGPTPPAQNGYYGVIKNVRVKNGKESGLPYLNVLVEHKAPADKPEHKIYDGAPQWIRVMFGDHNETEARLAAFIKAVTGKANKEANIVDTDEAARAGTGSLVKTIDGVKPDGKVVKFDVRERAAQNGYAASTEGDFIRRPLDAAAAAPVEEEADEVDDEDIEVEGEEAGEEEDGQTREERLAELKKESLVDLKAAAAAAEIDIKGLKKLEIVEAIVAWEFDESEEGEEEDDAAEEEDDELEVDEEEEDGEEEGEEEDDVDPEAEIRAELAGLDRTALKVRLKEADADAKVLKKDTDDDLRDKIVNAELGEPPF